MREDTEGVSPYLLFATEYKSFLDLLADPLIDSDVVKESSNVLEIVVTADYVDFKKMNAVGKRKESKEEKAFKKLIKTLNRVDHWRQACVDQPALIRNAIAQWETMFLDFPVVTSSQRFSTS